jgi:hypothetical protein
MKPKTAVTHSPTPWRVRPGSPESYDDRSCVRILSDDLQNVANAVGVKGVLNADFICRVVNSHDALVKALGEIRAHALASTTRNRTGERLNTIVDMATAALKLAEGA